MGRYIPQKSRCMGVACFDRQPAKSGKWFSRTFMVETPGWPECNRHCIQDSATGITYKTVLRSVVSNRHFVLILSMATDAVALPFKARLIWLRQGYEKVLHSCAVNGKGCGGFAQ